MLRRHMVLCTCELSACSVKTHCVPWASLRKSFRLATSVGPGCGRCFAEPFFAGIARTNRHVWWKVWGRTCGQTPQDTQTDTQELNLVP